MQDNDSPSFPPPDALVLEGYQYSELLGSTPLARTSRYLEHFSNAYVVIKEIHPSVYQMPGVEQRFQERLAQITSIEHPHVLRLMDHGRTDAGGYYMVREYVDGYPLREWMQTTGIDRSSALNLVITLAGAIDAWHQNDFVHGSVRASNIWIGQDSSVKLEGFPVSSLLDPSQLVQLLGLEVVNTMPPEFTSGTAFTPQSDIYALAAVYYELLTGSRPRGVMSPISPSVIVDSRARHVISKALSQCPTQRQASMSEFCSPLLMASAGPVVPSSTTVEQVNIKSYSSMAKPLMAILSLVMIVAGTGFYLWKRADGKNRPNPVSEAISAKETQTGEGQKVTAPVDEIESGKIPVIDSLRIKLHGTSGSSDRIKMVFLLDNSDQVQPLIQFSDLGPAGQGASVPPITHYRFEDAGGKPVSDDKALLKDGTFPEFRLELNLSDPMPSAVRLVLMPLKEHPPLTSNPVGVTEAIAEYRGRNQATANRKAIGRSLPNEPIPSPGSGDAYIFAAHFYLGADVSMLKLQFGNAGESPLICDNLAFQCAFSADDRLDSLLHANAEALPSPGQDLAAGGFTARWLGMDLDVMNPQKKYWTKHTFRIDTSNPDLLKHARFLLVTISPLYSTPESNYQNNVIAIPLEFPDQWHSVTQDPTDVPPTDENAPPVPATTDEIKPE